ncbi:hypothetical protein HEO92_022495 [Escherichia coli]|nr:hypothetical protein [Escherichia coli]
MAETTKERLNKQFAQLESERQSFEPHWRELSDYINPRGSRFLTSEVNRNDRRNTRIIDSTGTMAARTLASGMMSGITSPARPWFRLATPDPEMMDYGPVKLWLEAVQNRMNDMFNKSNLYQSLPQLYGSLGTYSTGAMAVLEDDEDIIRTMPFPIGSYYLAIRRADSNYYRAVTAGKTGTLRPSHTEGTSWDGWGGSGDDDTGIEWEYLHSGFGIARITAVNGTTATAEVISYIPSQVVGEDNASYKWAKYAWNSVNGYPGTVVYYQQRLYFAASTAFPQTIWASRTGDYKDFGKSNPTQDDDRIIYTYAGRQVNEIRHLIDVGSLVALTSGGEYVITGDQNKVLTPSSFAFSSQGSNGSSNVPPIAVANIALFVQEKGSVVRDLAYSFDVDGYQGNDLTILANHLFQKHSIVDWCFSIVPYSSAFCIRDDGKLLVMTYLRDQQVFAWAPQSSTGKYESTCSISEGNEDAVYFVVNRTVNGQTVRYIERLSSRLFTSDEDAFFVDSGLSYDGRNTSDRTMTITGGSGEWDYRAEYTISVSGGAYFTSSDVGAQLQFPYTGTDPDTGDEVSKELRCDIISVTSNTAVVVRANRNVPPSLRNVATTNWQMARRTFGGLSHLEGQTVNILSDANVEPQKVVSGGAVTLESPGAVVHIGLPITAEFETLDININGQETLLDKKQVIPSVTLVVNASRGIWATTPGGKWYEYPQREFEFYDDPVDDATGKVEVKLDSNWGKNGRVRIRQLDPLPLSVLAVIPRLTVGGF